MKYKVIKDLSQYTEYCKILERLFQTDFKKDQDQIELLELLILDYDNRNNQSQYHELNPVELLKSLLENGNLSQADFSKQINISRQLISDILNYRRNISKELVLKLADFFAMKQEAFSRPYSLKNNLNYATHQVASLEYVREKEAPYISSPPAAPDKIVRLSKVMRKVRAKKTGSAKSVEAERSKIDKGIDKKPRTATAVKKAAAKKR